MFAVCNHDGDELSGPWRTLEWAIGDARDRLEDDPELGEVIVWEIDPSGNLVTHHRTVTFGPDANWQSEVVVLKPGERIRAPGRVPRRITEDDLEGYDLGDPKRQALEERIGEWV
jgi:hypothetical protein